MTRLLDVHERGLKDPEYARDYEALEGEFTFAESLIQARLEAGPTRGAPAAGTRLRIGFEPADMATRYGPRGGRAA